MGNSGTIRVLATGIPGTKQNNTPRFFQSYLPFGENTRQQKVSQHTPCCVLNNKDIDPPLPFFYIYRCAQVLDSITTYHRMEKGGQPG